MKPMSDALTKDYWYKRVPSRGDDVPPATQQNGEALCADSTALLSRLLYEVTHNNNGMGGLNRRAINACVRLGLRTRADIVEALQNGSLQPGKPRFVNGRRQGSTGVRGYGWKTHIELSEWAGLPRPVKPHWERCPHCGQFIKELVTE